MNGALTLKFLSKNKQDEIAKKLAFTLYTSMINTTENNSDLSRLIYKHNLTDISDVAFELGVEDQLMKCVHYLIEKDEDLSVLLDSSK